MTSLHIATPDDLPRLLPMVAAYHTEEGIDSDESHLEAALAPLLDGTPLGVAYLIGPRRSPVGYIVISFGYSVELGGIDGVIDEFWIRPPVRGRGMGMDVLLGLIPALAEHGLCGISLEVDRDNTRAQKLYTRAGFRLREKYSLMTRVLR
jgi:ribosomal protein S18 acetylase RimI-like enzyme